VVFSVNSVASEDVCSLGRPEAPAGLAESPGKRATEEPRDSVPIVSSSPLITLDCKSADIALVSGMGFAWESEYTGFSKVPPKRNSWQKTAAYPEILSVTEYKRCRAILRRNKFTVGGQMAGMCSRTDSSSSVESAAEYQDLVGLSAIW
jgi:hypothetical protein